MTSADFSFLTLRNIKAYESTGGTVEDNYVLTVSSFGKQKWTNDLNLNSIITNGISSNIMTASEMSANSMTAIEMSANEMSATTMTTNALNATTLTTNALTTNSMTATAMISNEITVNTIKFNNNVNIIGKCSTIISTIRRETDPDGIGLPTGIPPRYKLLLYDPITHEMVYYYPVSGVN